MKSQKKEFRASNGIDREEEAGYSDDIVIEDESESNADTVKKLRGDLKKCAAEKQEYLNGWQRAKADFINARKADDEQRERLIKFAKEGLISDLLLAVDSFEMAFTNKQVWEKASKEWRVGIEQIYNQLIGVLKDHGLLQFEPIGERFDPARHDSVESVVVGESGKDNAIVEVAQKGYTLNGKVIRPAKVKVGKFE